MKTLLLKGAIATLYDAMVHMWKSYPNLKEIHVIECNNGCEVCDAARILNLACLEVAAELEKEKSQ